TWYEKEDLSSTDMHPFVHPFNRAVDPLWQARSDWDIYRSIAEDVSELAKTHFPGVYKDLVTSPLAHDSPQEISQPMGEEKYMISMCRLDLIWKMVKSVPMVLTSV